MAEPSPRTQSVLVGGGHGAFIPRKRRGIQARAGNSEKKKEDRLLLIRTHLELKKEAATLLAQAEEQSLDHFYTVSAPPGHHL